MMSKVIVLVFSLVGLFSISVSQVIQQSQCDNNVPIHPNFDIKSFLGTWIEYARTDNPNQPGECSSFQFTDELGVSYSSVNNNFLEEATGTIAQEGDNGKLKLTISSFPDPIDFWVLEQTAIDLYATFAIAFSCQNISPTERKIHVWVIRRQDLDLLPPMIAFINVALNTTFGIELSELRTIDHEEETCKVLPVIEPGEPIILRGECDRTIPVVQNFDIDKFSGLWHQISSYETENGKGACVRAEYNKGENGMLNILNSKVVDRQVISIDGQAELTGTEAKLTVVLNIPGEPATPRDLWILQSDYNNYAVAYSCVNLENDNRRIYSWILSRSRQLSPTIQAAVDGAIRPYIDLNSAYYQPTDQSDPGCFFYPEASDKPVVFRGQCESVNVKPMDNFNAERYMGTWHIIEMYPSLYQDGTCSNAFYDLVDGQVIVVNTQVKDQRLETVRGVAVPAADGSAKLVVTFPGAGSDEPISTEYWILDTDYTSYALVYTCQNLNENDMQVNSWKLSNTKQLSPEAAQAIDAFISPIPYLDYRYYNEEVQSEAGCFYFPEPQDNVPVVFPGRCDESIAAVPNLDFSEFAGTWHEIESYPTGETTGQCVNHELSFINSTHLNLTSASVINQFKRELGGVISRTSATDNSGKLTIAITDANGQVKNIPFWVLSTVYNDYAFAYGCENIGDDFRAVWSWKLSRTNELSIAATTAINNIMETNIVLQDKYFKKLDHSNDACFYLPNLDPGEPVILLGQCDRSIAGVPDFNIEKYEGRWRLIESYGSDFQQGTCNVARYTQQTSNTLAITNSQVVNGELTSISGTATVTGTDGSGRLTFNLGGESFEVLILATDYVSYSLGYGCVDLPNNQRRVYSWKMSRENTLSPDAINHMNEVIDRNQVLSNAFYYLINRTDAGCFYLPTPDPNASVKFRGQCDQNIPVATDFEPEKYLGTWYDIESYPGDFQNGKCNTATYSEHPEPGIDVDVYNTQVINEALFTVRGTAVLDPSTDGSAKLTVTFNVGGNVVTSDYWVLATDYDSYALVYSCRPVDDEYVQVTSWKLSRFRELQPAAKIKIDEVMEDIRVLDQRYFLQRNHTPEGCFYYPEPQPGVPVVFPGQCDENIVAEPNFDMNLFQGTWHEISAYPKANQDGQCISQQFTVNATNSMRLDSFSVLDLTQSTTEGHVTFASDNDPSGKLNINIWVNGEAQSIPYWILSTDYNHYALAYSCVNIDRDTRGVWSWKLSKTRQLSQESNSAIQEAIAKVDVLRDDYYETVQQTDVACFHLPDITPGDNVVLPGRCDHSIVGKSDFDISRYAGEWRLIESYGSRYQSGTCNVAQYTLQSSNVLAITNSQVVNGELTSISGTATVTSTDGSGELTFEMITSWKFSRFNTLSSDATNRINEIIDGIEVLHQPYYYHVNRTSYACFYFPEADKNTPVRFRGQCEHYDVPVVSQFDIQEYMGLWYDIESYPMVFQDGECPNALYTAINSTTASVYNTHVVNQRLGVINGLATVTATDGSAKLKVTFDGQNPDVASNYWVLATDYKSYAFVYSCTNDGEDYMNVASWKLSRTRELESDAKTEIDIVMNDIRPLNQKYFIERHQTPEACFYYPEAQPGVPVVFPGQCDENIVAEPNFDMNLFQGTWHEISAYPKANQDGQCISQQFTVNATNSMRLDSFSVLDRIQSTTEGHVTFASDNDPSGKLNINIWVNGEAQSIPYWILSTDYSHYALVYSCVNIDKDTRGVWSWKLSKTRQLSQESNSTIQEAIAKVDVLRNDYYETVQQTDSACFFYPDLGPSDPVVFPGQCNSNIPTVPNFDATRYQGRWRLLESYYSEFQEGACNAAQYTVADDGSIIVVNSKVVDEELISVTGTAVLDASGTGKLVVSFPNSAPTEYWILDTDYDSYALIYSCENISNDQRRVWSWKMSKGSNSFSVAAENEMNQIINNVDVLDERYYNSINRSEVDCFYYPPPPTEDNSFNSLIFPGQCDESIIVKQNFDAESYRGTWYDIESYPSNHQIGTCNTAKYTWNPDGSFTVENTQVVDQLLETITGTAVPSTTDGSAKYDFTTSGSENAMKYWVLDTDYTRYSLVYSCRNIDDEFREVHSWKLGREPIMPEEVKSIIDDAIEKVQVLEKDYFIPRQHTAAACFYYPDMDDGHIIMNGQCPSDDEVPVVTNFNPVAFSGLWYEVSRYPSELQNGECVATEYTLSVGNNFDVTHTSVISEEKLKTVTQASFATNGRGVIDISVNGVPFNKLYILASDNEMRDYALAYSCRDLDDDRKQLYSWKLSRTRAGLSEAANNAIKQLISTNIDLYEPYYETTSQDHASCFYYPEFDELPPTIELPGPCNESITGIADFNMLDYSGTWYEVARYPQPAQTGQCNRAVYTPQDTGIFSFVHSQVTDEALSEISGSAVAGDDGSIEVTFNVGGETRTAKYYILATDYNSYALLYSCVTIDDGERRQVGSWKLSKTRELSPQANSEIEAVISRTQGLTQQYYQETIQTDVACFYYPEFIEPPPYIELPGLCNLSVSAVPDFRIEEFLGPWFEVSRYPQPAQTGQCNLIQFNTGSTPGSITILATEIIDESLLEIRGDGRVSSSDGSGRLTVSYDSDSVLDHYVLATDYAGFALIYTCINLPDVNRRRVYSWILSRNTELSTAANDTVNEIIDATQGLKNDYYLDTSHSHQACFYYPPQTGDKVIIPGQCDENIPAMQSFNVARFANNTWYHIERYDAVGDSSCVGTRLTYDDGTGGIDVLNFEVVDEVLLTKEGSGRLNSSDGSGIFSLVMDDSEDEEETETKIYILATDYDEYALAYTCKNINSDQRQVGAWKLSRGRVLTEEHKAAIAEIIKERPELHEPYFKSISHHEECLEPSSAFFFKSSILLIFVCAVLNLLW